MLSFRLCCCWERGRRDGRNSGSLSPWVHLGDPATSLPGLWASHSPTLNLSLLICERGTPCRFGDNNERAHAECPALCCLRLGAGSVQSPSLQTGLGGGEVGSLWTAQGGKGFRPPALGVLVRGWHGWSRHGFSYSAEESVYAGPQPLGPLLPVGAWAGTDLLAAALHTTLRVCLLPEQKVRSSQGPEGGLACHWGCGGAHCLRQEGQLACWVGRTWLAPPGRLVLVAQPRGIPRVLLCKMTLVGRWWAAVTSGLGAGPPGRSSGLSPSLRPLALCSTC